MSLRKAIAAIGPPLLLAAAPSTAYAHGFGERYDLPVPLSLYVIGAGTAVALSFVVIVLFARGGAGGGYPRANLLRWRAARLLADGRFLFAVKLASAAVFVTYLVAGFAGNSDPNRNLVPTMTWVVFWVGLAYLSGLVGNLWALINPWKILFGWAEALWRRSTGGRLSRGVEYPPELGAWPAVALFLVFAWAEVAWPDSGRPSRVAALALAYTGVTFAGMYVYGRDTWLKHGEALSMAMAFFARLAPTEVRAPALVGQGQVVDDYEAYSKAPPAQREWNLRPWGSGLLTGERLTLSGAAFLVLMLSTVSFDGFSETPLWASFLADSFSAFSWLGVHAFTGIRTFGLLLTPTLLFGAFALTALLMRRIGQSEESVGDLIGRFAVSLAPIALAYHVAHFLSFLLIQGQRIVPLASDPLGEGWDLFGTAGYVIDIGVVNARFAWIVGVAAIVIGHIAAVYAAHVIAGWTFASRALALRSQLPMMALMTGYTMLSLWIVAQPIVSD